MNGVFDTKPNSGYDDELSRHYHFPSQYLPLAQALVGHWIVYREPQRNGGRRAYIAVARVSKVYPDPKLPGHSYADVVDYFPFDELVPLKFSGDYAEEDLRAIGNPKTVGTFLRGKSVRYLGGADFAAIVRVGLKDTLDAEKEAELELASAQLVAADTPQFEPPAEEQARRIEQILSNKAVRKKSFRRKVCDAYQHRCAITGLKMLSLKGLVEAQAAHIWSVENGGPDVVQNGIALTSTLHWLFDNHLISISEDYRLLVRKKNIPDRLLSLFIKEDARIYLPEDQKLWPHPIYLAKHRDIFISLGPL